jgi:hypothetical protein
MLIVPAVVNAQAPAPAPTPDPTNAVPYSVQQKFKYRTSQIFGFRGLVIAAAGAGIAQARNEPKEWGGGAAAYGKRYGSAFGERFTVYGADFILESAFHEDPRYFPSRETTFGPRFTHAVLRALITHTDSGSDRFAFAKVTSAFASGQIVNAWQPASNNKVSDGLIRAGLTLAEDAAVNVIKEFIPRFRDH